MPRYTYGSSEDHGFKVVKLPKPLQDFIDRPPPEGTRNDALMAAACQARDIRWTKSEAESTLLPAAERAGLSEGEAHRTISSAYTWAPRGIPGYFVPCGTPGAKPYKKNAKKEIIYDLETDFTLPPPMEDGAITLIEKLFRPGEHVYFNRAVLGPDGDKESVSTNSDHQVAWTREALVKALRERASGDPAKIFGAKNHGVYFCVNPIGKTSNRRVVENIADLRYGLIEFDNIKVEDQLQVILRSRVPGKTVSTSGGKSIHVIVKVDAGLDLALYKSRMLAYMEHFRAYSVDPQTKDPTRLSRLPGATREDTGRRQDLLLCDVGAESYEEWEQELVVEKDGLPALRDAEDLLGEIDMGLLRAPSEIIQGVGHRGLKMVVGGASKARKTWCLIDLAVSVSTGAKWMGELQCNEGNVLFINMELPEYFMGARIRAVADAKGLKLRPKSIYLLNLRGFADHLLNLRPKLEALIEKIDFSLIVLDPKYKLMPGADEIGTADTSTFLNEIDKLAVKCDALCVFADHFSKGNQAAKKAQDRLSGTGITSRDGDSIVTMTEHVEDLALSVDFILRNHPPMPSFVIKWEHPLFVVDHDLDPTKLAEPPVPSKKTDEVPAMITPGTIEAVHGYVKDNPEGQNKLVEHLASVFGKTQKEAKMKILPFLLEKGILIATDGPKKGLYPTKIYSFKTNDV